MERLRNNGDKGPENEQGCTTEKEQGEDSCPRPAWRMKREGSRRCVAKQSKTKSVSDAFEHKEHLNITEQFLQNVGIHITGKYQENIAKENKTILLISHARKEIQI